MKRPQVDWPIFAGRLDVLLGIAGVIIGVGLILYGYVSEDLHELLIGLGGAVLGAGVSVVATAFSTHTRELEVDTLLEGAIPYGGFETSEAKLHKFRTSFHCYFVTENPAEELVGKTIIGWQYMRFDLTKYRPGKLQGTVLQKNEEYQVEGFLKKDSLMLCRTHVLNVDQELVATFLFQDFANIYPDDFNGVLMTETLVGGRSISACILAKKELVVRALDTGDISAGDQKNLSTSWYNGLRNYGYMFFHLPGYHSENEDVFGPIPKPTPPQPPKGPLPGYS